MSLIPDVLGIKAAAIAGGIALVVGIAGGCFITHLFYAPRLELKDTQLRQANDRIQVLGADITRQNDAVQAEHDAGKERATQAEKALAAAQADRKKAESDAKAIMQRQPKPGENRCTAASALIHEELGQ